MARLLLTGHSETAARVQTWLLRWGHSVVHALNEAAFVTAASMRRTDAVVIVCDGQGVGGCCPASLPLPADTAPLIMVGRSGATCRRAGVFLEHVPHPGKGGRRLRRALRYCLLRAEQARRHAAEVKIHHEYIQFLGHEIRTPLTSASAALEIVEGEFAARGAGDERLAGFVQIALRNLKRLCDTVEWTEDYLGARTVALAPRWQEGRVGELIARAAGLEAPRPDLSLVFEGGAEAKPFVCDGALLRTLVQQVLHALRYHAPGARVTMRLRTSEGAGRGGWPGGELDDGTTEIVVALHLSWPPEGRGPTRVSCTGLVGLNDAPDQELARLIQFTVSREILDLFGARLTIPSAGDAPALVLTLPAVPPGAVPVSGCELRLPVCP